MFLAPKTDDYLLELSSDYSSFNYTINSSHEISPAANHTESDSLSEHGLHYWWIPNVGKGDTLIAGIETVAPNYWTSTLYYSNGSTAQTVWAPHAHSHIFLAPKTDDYLLELSSDYNSFNYNINCFRPMYFATPHTKTGNLSEHEFYHLWIPNVGEDDTLIVGIEAIAPSYWTSTLYYSNGSVAQIIWAPHAHSHVFFAPKTDDYLLELSSDYSSFNYTIRWSHARLSTEIIFSVSPNPAIVGQTVTFLGNLTTDTGTPIPNAAITIKVNGIKRLSLQTNTTGWFKASGKATHAGFFNLTAEYAGSTQYLPSSDWVILTISKVQTEIYAKLIPNPVNPGATCELRGILIDQFSNPIKSATVSLEYSTDYGSSWHPAGTLTTNSYGIFSKTLTVSSIGIYLFRISYAGSPSHESSTTITALIVR